MVDEVAEADEVHAAEHDEEAEAAEEEAETEKQDELALSHAEAAHETELSGWEEAAALAASDEAEDDARDESERTGSVADEGAGTEANAGTSLEAVLTVKSSANRNKQRSIACMLTNKHNDSVRRQCSTYFAPFHNSKSRFTAQKMRKAVRKGHER